MRITEGYPVADIIASRKWDRALFTTFTLSLTYFETTLLPILQQQGCSQIWLVTDAHGYRYSLIERKSMKIGMEYRVIPVALEKGVFHAKCTYLAGPEGDLLCVGSGNLTFGGHGQNLEVLEVLQPESALQCFHEFSGFLKSLGRKSGFINPDKEWITEFSSLASDAVEKANASDLGQARLLHSVDGPLLDQLAKPVTEIAPVREAILMSPFYDPAGTAVIKLLDQTKPKKIKIGSVGNSSTFPFSKAKSWAIDVKPVQPSFKETRPLHAKWIELLGLNGRLLLTGSVNVTNKALCTTENVEVGILRRLQPDEALVDWKARKAPKEDLLNPKSSGLGNIELVHAKFRKDDNALSGHIISLQGPEGEWRCSLVAGNGVHEDVDALVQEDGSFIVHEPKLVKFSLLPAVQIAMRLNNREARGWVHNDGILSVGRIGGLGAGAVTRLISRSATDDDLVALLEYLSMSASKYSPVFNARIHFSVTDNETKKPQDEIVTVSLGALETVENPDGVVSWQPGLGENHEKNILSLFGRLRRSFLGDNESRAGVKVREEVEKDEHDSSEKDDTRSDSLEMSVQKFENSLWEIIQTPVQASEDHDVEAATDKKRALLCMLFEVAMRMRLWRQQDRDEAVKFMKGWLLKTIRIVPPQKVVGPIEQHVITSIAILGVLEKAMNCPEAAMDLHEQMDVFYRGCIDIENVRSALIYDPYVGFAARLLGDDCSDLAESFEAIISVPPRRVQLLCAYEAAATGEVSEDMPIFQDGIGKELLAALKSPNYQSMVKLLSDHRARCAHKNCYAMKGHEAWNYSVKRIAKCIHCNRYTVNISL